MSMWAPPPFRIAFDNARDPYTARNALGITATAGPPGPTGPTGPAGPTGPTGPAGVVSATPPLSLTGGVLSIAPTWTTYTPTVSCTTGTLTSASATGKYITMGKLTLVQIVITITTVGTAGGNIIATLPNTCAVRTIAVGRENAVSGKMLQAAISNVSSTVQITNYDNTFAGANGASMYINGFYENT